MPDRLLIGVDISDWQTDEPRKLHGAADIRSLLWAGRSVAEVARRAVIWQALGLAEDTILPPWPGLLQAGVMQAIRWRYLRGEKEQFGLGASTVTLPCMIGPDATLTERMDYDPHFEPTAFAYVYSPRAHLRAVRYLTNVVPGHIRNHLAIVALNGGNVREQADALKAEIDAQVAALTGDRP